MNSEDTKKSKYLPRGVTIGEDDKHEIFDTTGSDERLATLYGASEPQEYTDTLEKVGDHIWKKVRDKRAFIPVVQGRSIVIPMEKIVKIEVSKQ